VKELPAIFQDGERTYAADTCEPLKTAAAQGEVSLHAWGHALYPGTLLPRSFLPAVRSVGVWDAPVSQSWGLDRHCNEGLELTYLHRGRTAFEVDGKQWPLRRGCLTITRPWQFHQVGAPHIGACRLTWLILDVGVRRPNQTWRWPEWLVCSEGECQKLTRLLSHNEQPVWQIGREGGREFSPEMGRDSSREMSREMSREAGAEIEGWFHKLAALVEDGSDPLESESKLKLAINGLLLAVLELLEAEQIPLDAYLSTSQRAVQLFLQALPEHAASDWDLQAMAHQCGLSRSQFSEYCRQLTGMTPMQYLTHCRVEMAAQMLATRPQATITEIAYACGFNSSQYFATVFRGAKGCAPSAYAAPGGPYLREVPTSRRSVPPGTADAR
jgi:AraC family L-rhamnose operon regulatory protein RhaS